MIIRAGTGASITYLTRYNKDFSKRIAAKHVVQGDRVSVSVSVFHFSICFFFFPFSIIIPAQVRRMVVTSSMGDNQG